MVDKGTGLEVHQDQKSDVNTANLGGKVCSKDGSNRELVNPKTYLYIHDQMDTLNFQQKKGHKSPTQRIQSIKDDPYFKVKIEIS